MKILIINSNIYDTELVVKWINRTKKKSEIFLARCNYSANEILKASQPSVAIWEDEMFIKHTSKFNGSNQKEEFEIVVTRPIRIITVHNTSSNKLSNFLVQRPAAIIYFPELQDYIARILEMKEEKIFYSYTIRKLLEIGEDISLTNSKMFLTLTTVELRITQLIVQGYKTSEIAKILFISKNTVSDHRKNIKIKLDLKGGKQIFISYLNSNLSQLFNL
jgi:DNA-binding CsgD family transcriptional regulator